MIDLVEYHKFAFYGLKLHQWVRSYGLTVFYRGILFRLVYPADLPPETIFNQSSRRELIHLHSLQPADDVIARINFVAMNLPFYFKHQGTQALAACIRKNGAFDLVEVQGTPAHAVLEPLYQQLHSIIK